MPKVKAKAPKAKPQLLTLSSRAGVHISKFGIDSFLEHSHEYKLEHVEVNIAQVYNSFADLKASSAWHCKQPLIPRVSTYVQ